MKPRKRSKAPVANFRQVLIEIGNAISRLGASLPVSGGAAKPVVATAKKAPAAKRVRPARRRPAAKPMSPTVRKNLQLQGRYMAAVRSLSVANKDKIRQLRARKGIEAAIAAAKRLGK